MRLRLDTSNAREVRRCAKCGKTGFIVRHHMGNDKYLGYYSKVIYDQYYKYLECVDLCGDTCHMEIHYIYHRYTRVWLDRTPASAMRMRTKLIGVCQRWLRGEINKPKVSRKFKRQWQKSLSTLGLKNAKPATG